MVGKEDKRRGHGGENEEQNVSIRNHQEERHEELKSQNKCEERI